MKPNVLIRWRRPISAVLAAVFLVSGLLLFRPENVSAESGMADEIADDATVKDYQKNIADLAEKQESLKAEIAALNDSVEDLTEKKTHYDELIAVCEEKIAMSEELLLKLQLEEEAMTADIEKKTSALEELHEQVKARMVISYEAGGFGATYLEFIFDAKNVIDLLMGIERAASLLEYDTKLMNDYRSLASELEEERAALDAQIAEQEDLISSLEAEREEADLIILRCEKLIETAMKDIESRAAIMEQFARDEDEAARELDEFIEELMRQKEEEKAVTEPETTTPPPPETDPLPEETDPVPDETDHVPDETTETPGDTETDPAEPDPGTDDTPEPDDTFMWPLDPKYKTITSPFGSRLDPFTGVPSTHGGTDIYAPKGSNIYASRSGTVVKATYSSSYGNYILIDHGDGLFTLYAHSSKLLVSAGTYVEKGTVIAEVGMTGSATGYHLHFEVREGTTRVDPLGYVKIP